MSTTTLTLTSHQYSVALNKLARYIDEGVYNDDLELIPDHLAVNYIHEEENFTITFTPITTKTLGIKYHLNSFTIDDSVVRDIGFTVEMVGEDGRMFRVIGVDRGCDYKTVRRWLEQRIINPTATRKVSNQEFLEFMFILSFHLALYYPEALIRKEKSNGDVFLTPVFGFKQKLTEVAEKKYREYRIKHLYDGWDCIRITEKEYFKARDLTVEFDYPYMNACALDKFCVRVERKHGRKVSINVVYFDLNPKTGILKVELNDEMHPFESFSIPFQIIELLADETKKHTIKVDLIKDELDLKKQELIQEISEKIMNVEEIVYVFFDLNRFMLHYGDVATDIKEIECKPSKGEQDKYSKGDRSTTRLFKCYTLKKYWVSKVQRKKAEFTCLAWGVRGHWRHYRNGKKVFVNAYIKGKEKDKYQGKDYILFPKSEDEEKKDVGA